MNTNPINKIKAAKVRRRIRDNFSHADVMINDDGKVVLTYRGEFVNREYNFNNFKNEEDKLADLLEADLRKEIAKRSKQELGIPDIQLNRFGY